MLDAREDSVFLHLHQVRDAVIAMLDAWTGDKGRVPVDKLAAPLVDATLAAPKASPDAKVRLCTPWAANAHKLVQYGLRHISLSDKGISAGLSLSYVLYWFVHL